MAAPSADGIEHHDAVDDRDDGDDDAHGIAEQRLGFVTEMVYLNMHTMTKGLKAPSLNWTTVITVLEFLQMFLLVFHPDNGWLINEDLWVYKAIQWVNFRVLVADPAEYAKYVAVFYAIVGVVLVILGSSAWIAWSIKKGNGEDRWVRRATSVLNFVEFNICNTMWISIADFCAFMADCQWSQAASTGTAMHSYWTDQSCLAMPHIIHLAVAAVMLLLVAGAVTSMGLALCELNPMTRNHAATLAPGFALKRLALKMVMVVAARVLGDLGAARPVVLMLAAWILVWCAIQAKPYYHAIMNHVWLGLYLAVAYAATLLTALMVSPNADSVDNRTLMTNRLLWGIFPITLAGMLASFVQHVWLKRPLQVLAASYADPANHNTIPKNAYRFSSSQQVVLMACCMRKWDEDGVADKEAAKFGEQIIKAGIARFPSCPWLLTVYANFLLQVHKNNQVSSKHLQVAEKSSPNFLDRYFIYICHVAAKALRASSDGSVDLIGYVELQRNYRSCIRSHQRALASQRKFWQMLLRDSVSVGEVRAGFQAMAATEAVAQQAYKRCIERYPNNGRLMRAYGRLLEYVCHDPWAASRCYQEATKLGLHDSMMSLAGGGGVDSTDAAGRLTGMAGAIDEKVDGLVVTSADGTILMVNQACYKMFGYDKSELDGKNVSLLMPAPYSQHHSSFMSRYAASRVPKFLDKSRPLVGLHKDNSIMAITVAATQLSGIGNDAIFMAVIRPTEAAKAADGSVSKTIRVWCTTNGVIMCAERRVAGIPAPELVGRNFASLGEDMQGLHKFIVAAAAQRGAPTQLRCKLMHKYQAPIEVDLQLDTGDLELSLVVVSITPLAEAANLMVVDATGTILYATSQMAGLVGHPAKSLPSMNISALMPSPAGQLHGKWLTEPMLKPPATSCRNPGNVVHLMTATNSLVPVTLAITPRDTEDGRNYIIEATKSSDEAYLDQRRIQLTIDQHGRVIGPGSGAKGVFGFEPAVLAGRQLSEFVDLFQMWIGREHGDAGLLALMAVRAQEHAQPPSYRCGVQAPAKATSHTSDTNSHAALLKSLMTGPSIKPAIMVLTMLSEDSEAAQDEPSSKQDEAPVQETSSSFYAQVARRISAANAEAAAAVVAEQVVPMCTLELWRAEGLTAVVELDRRLAISRADTATGLLFGLPSVGLVKTPFTQLVPIPGVMTPSDLIAGSDSKQRKRGAAKLTGWRLGPIRVVQAQHGSGAAPIQIHMQAAVQNAHSYSRSKTIVRLQLQHAAVGSMEVLESLRGGRLSSGGDAPNGTAREAVRLRPSEDDDEDGTDLGDETTTYTRAQTAFTDLDGGDGIASISINRAGTGLGSQPKAEASGNVGKVAPPSNSGVARVSAGGMEGVGDGGSEFGVEADTKDELTSDWRLAKRLKKLRRLIMCPAAQVATARYWRQHKPAIAVVLLLSFIVSAILISQIDLRAKNPFIVETMTDNVDRAPQMASYATVAAGCRLPKFQAADACSSDNVAFSMQKLSQSMNQMRLNHQDLYLQPFHSQRLVAFWTNPTLPQLQWQPFHGNGSSSDSFQESNASLWSMGNAYVAAADEVLYFMPRIGSAVFNSSSYQYMQANVETLVEAYGKSVDIFVDFMYLELGVLATITAICLAIECVLGTVGFAWLGPMTMCADVEATRRLSVLLAMPTAALRYMATHVIPIEDDEKEQEVEDDDLEQVEAAEGDGAASAAMRAARTSDDCFMHSGTGQTGFSQEGYGLSWVFPTIKQSGKAITPSPRDYIRHVGTNFTWFFLTLILYGVTFQALNGLRRPLIDLDVMAHVMRHASYTNMYAAKLAFAQTADEKALFRGHLLEEVDEVEAELATLLYGGDFAADTEVSFNGYVPAAAYHVPSLSTTFFQTRLCLRVNQSSCFDEGSPWYEVTHHGLNPMLERLVKDMRAFANVSDADSGPDNQMYQFVVQVGQHDMNDGLHAANAELVDWTLQQFGQVRLLHVVLVTLTVLNLVYTIYLMGFAYPRELRLESRRIANMLSMLPDDANVETVTRRAILAWRGRTSADVRPGERSMTLGGGDMSLGFSAGNMSSNNW